MDGKNVQKNKKLKNNVKKKITKKGKNDEKQLKIKEINKKQKMNIGERKNMDESKKNNSNKSKNIIIMAIVIVIVLALLLILIKGCSKEKKEEKKEENNIIEKKGASEGNIIEAYGMSKEDAINIVKEIYNSDSYEFTCEIDNDSKYVVSVKNVVTNEVTKYIVDPESKDNSFYEIDE